jgi:hypothetical protein
MFLGISPGKVLSMLHRRLRPGGRSGIVAVAAAFALLFLAAASPALGQDESAAGADAAEAPLAESQDWAASWLWKWSEPYNPQTLTLWGGTGLFLRGQGKLRTPSSAEEQVILDLKTRSVRETFQYMGVQTSAYVPMTLDQYRSSLTTRNLRDHWMYYGRRGLSKVAGDQAPIGTLKLELPVEVPKSIQKVIGRGKPNLRVSGSETITISGRSTWQVDSKATEAGRQSKFPQLNLKQDLAVNVSGDIGDKINVDIDQNSQGSLANRIRINYRGYDDEVLQTLDLGNTNLSLPGSQFVSYNGRHQGLFGVKANGRLGDLDITMIASKQEGQSGSSRFVGNSTVRTSVIGDLNYSARTFYFLGDPRELGDGEPGHRLRVDLSSLEVWVDDRNAANNNGQAGGKDNIAVPGKAYLWTGKYKVETVGNRKLMKWDGDGIEKQDKYMGGDFNRLISGEDYRIVYFYQGIPTIWLTRPLTDKEVLAVAYFDSTQGQIGNTAVEAPDSLEFRLLKVPSVNLRTVNPEDNPSKEGFYDPTGPYYPTLRYEMKNIYNLGASGILPDGFDLSIYPKNGTEYDDDLDGIPYTQLLGLDRVDQNGRSLFAGGQPDGEIDVDQGSVFLTLGLLVFPDLRPFAPDSVDIMYWRPRFFPEGVCEDVTCSNASPDSAVYPPLKGDNAIPEIYDRKNVRQGEDTEYKMLVQYRSSLYGETIFLQGNVLEGSETVTANGQRLEKGRDYTIDYETGAVSLISDVARESAADIAIDYSYKPLFALGQRTLLGFTTNYSPVEDYALSTTWIYESKGATERRPKLGEEPSLTVIGDLAGSMRKTPGILTRLVDGLPLVSTDSPSSVNLAGEIGMSFPNPNTKNHGYVEDFEGSRDDLSIDLSRLRWFYSSLPAAVPNSPIFKGALRWYNPREDRRVQAKDLQPDLTSVEADDSVESVEFDYDPRDGGGESWAGLTETISSAGADLSQKQYLEFWVNDEFTDASGNSTFYRDVGVNPDSARIYVDIGTVSEDAMWDINTLPNNVLDTEDRINVDGEVDDSDAGNEDTGLDIVLSANEIGPTQTGAVADGDPNGDDYDLDPDLKDVNPEKFARINGTEDNDRIDTEDLNRNGVLETENNYYEYGVNLADPNSKYLVDEVTEVGEPTGWRRYRIPVRDGAIRTEGSPSLDSVQHIRVWLTGFSTRSRIQIARMAITGNRWTRKGVSDSSGTLLTENELKSRGEEFLVGVVNNKEDLNYAPPFDPGEDGTIQRREQSLLLSYRNLDPWHTALAFRAYDPAKDFTLYRQVKFYVLGDQTLPGVYFFVRFGDDERYYQVKVPVRSGWQEVVVDIQELTSLKTEDAPDSVVVGDRVYSVVGTPRFNQVSRISTGLINESDTPASGKIWFDDIRLGDVRRDVGIASRLNVQMALADFMNISGSFDGQDEDFLAIGQNKGSGVDRKRMALSGKINTHKLFAPLHMTLPVSFNWSENSSVPKFRTGDDRELLQSQIGQERTLARNTSLSADIARSPSRNPWLKYTVDAVRASFRWSKNRLVSPVRADTTEVVTTRLRYDLTPPQKRVKLLPGFNLAYLPSNFSVSMNTTSETRTSFDKNAGAQTKNVTLKPAQFQMDVGHRPVSSLALNYGLSSSRDLLLKRRVDFLGGLNIGTELSRQENVRANFSPRVFWWLGSPSFSYTGSYRENHNPGLTTEQDRASGETRRNVNNSSTYRTGLNLPWSQFMDKLAAAGGDSIPAASPLAWGKALFGTLGEFSQITFSHTVTDQSSYAGVYGVPDLRYKLGLSRDLGRESRTAPSGSMSLSRSQQTEARTDGAIFKDYRVSVSYSREDRDSKNTSGTTYDRAISWPDLKVDVAGLESKLNLDGYMSRLSAQTAYSARENKNVAQGGKQRSLANVKNWQPLVSVNAVWKGGLTTTFSANHRAEERTTSNANIVQSRTISSTAYSVNLQKTIRAGEGVKMPFGKSTRSQKTINFTMNFSYSTNKSARVLTGGATLVDSDSDKLRAVSRATYNFSSNMVGTLELSFDQTRNNKVRRTIRGIGVNASARVRF